MQKALPYIGIAFLVVLGAFMWGNHFPEANAPLAPAPESPLPGETGQIPTPQAPVVTPGEPATATGTGQEPVPIAPAVIPKDTPPGQPATSVITEKRPNYATYRTTAPQIGRAGSTVTDPVLGTRILRLTDSSDGNKGCSIQYSSWPVFNKNSTRLAVICAYGYKETVLYTFNPATFTAGARSTPDITCLSDFWWSGQDPDILFCRGGKSGTELTAYNAASGSTKLVRDFAPEVIQGGSLDQMSRSGDDDVWAFTLTDAAGDPAGYLVWKKSTNQVIERKLLSREIVDGVHIDKSGSFLIMENPGGDTRVVALRDHSVTPLTWGTDGFYHHDVGKGTVIADCGAQSGLCFRSLLSPHHLTLLLPFTESNQEQVHFTMLADNEAWALVTNEESTGSANGPEKSCTITAPFQCELYQVATDGSGKVRRLVHHYSTASTYEHQAFGNISRDGRFLAWSSDWGNANGRLDVYLAQITPAP